MSDEAIRELTQSVEAMAQALRPRDLPVGSWFGATSAIRVSAELASATHWMLQMMSAEAEELVQVGEGIFNRLMAVDRYLKDLASAG